MWRLVGRYRSPLSRREKVPFFDQFGVRSSQQLRRDLKEILRGTIAGTDYQFDLGSAGLLRPDLSLPAFSGLVPADGRAPIYNLFDHSRGADDHYTTRVSRGRARDFRGGRLSYDDHAGTDFTCPIGLPIVAAAAGTVVLIRDRWLRGGLTATIDHGEGLTTQYSHLARVTVALGDRARRGDIIGVAGASGYDLMQFFPLVPPHLHFMAWIAGRPVDPFASELWNHDGKPDDVTNAPPTSPVDQLALAQLIRDCTDPGLRDEIERHRAAPVATTAALLDDALFHQGTAAWPASCWGRVVRPAVRSDHRGRLSLPLSPADYPAGPRFADTFRTRPSRR